MTEQFVGLVECEKVAVTELPNSVKQMNNYLQRDFGYWNALYPKYRISWAEDQYEKRYVTHNRFGFELSNPVIEERPKYSWLKGKFILEACILVPKGDKKYDLAGDISYECIWVFERGNGDALPPNYTVCKFVIETRERNMNFDNSSPKYPDEVETKEEKEARLKILENELFGNETRIGDRLAIQEGIVVPQSYNGERNVTATDSSGSLIESPSTGNKSNSEPT